MMRMHAHRYIDKDANCEVVVFFTRRFARRDKSGCGFSFECAEDGTVSGLNPCAMENFEKCVSGEYDVADLGVERSEMRERLCSCGSLLSPEDVYDARGIFVARVCSKCRKSRLSRYRADIFVDSNYETDEQIDDDY